MGDEAGIAQGLRAGACGIVPVCANYEPRTFVQAYQAAQEHDWEALARHQARVMVLRQHLPLAAPNWIAGIKHALARRGIGTGKPVSPLEPLNAAQVQVLDEFLEAQSSPRAALPNPMTKTTEPNLL
jgi:dihydrodipicolinate synthase/N-acetylneuraminate lyase